MSSKTNQPPELLTPLQEQIDRLSDTIEKGIAPFFGSNPPKDATGRRCFGLTDAVMGLTDAVVSSQASIQSELRVMQEIVIAMMDGSEDEDEGPAIL